MVRKKAKSKKGLKKYKKKRIVFLGDTHSGHRVGLTPPDWQVTHVGGVDAKERKKYATLREEMWNWYVGEIEALKPIDYLVGNGDLIDGKGPRSGGTEIILPDRHEQCEAAADCLSAWDADRILLTYGTPYHTGVNEDFERVVAKNVKADRIVDQLHLDINGIKFNVKHHVSSSSIPHGRYTAIARERLWNIIWGEKEIHPKADVIIRSHVHYHVYAGDAYWLGIILPALQAPAVKYGRKLSGSVEFGFVVFDIDEEGGYTWQPRLLNLEGCREKSLKL